MNTIHQANAVLLTRCDLAAALRVSVRTVDAMLWAGETCNSRKGANECYPVPCDGNENEPF